PWSDSLGSSATSGLALEVRDLLGLAVGALLVALELLLGLALALLLTALAPQRRVVGEVAGGLLDAAADLVGDAHVSASVRRGLHRRPTRGERARKRSAGVLGDRAQPLER